jgi:DNA-binding transcriptional ArsR family regulator
MANDNAQLAALGDPTRRQIFELVAQKPRSVAEITREMTVSQSAVSQHLKVLRESQLVRAEPRGASNVYQIDPAGLGAIRAWLDQFWDANLKAFQIEVETSQEDEK